MNKEIIETFLALVDQNSDLQGKVAALKREAETHQSRAVLAEGLAALSTTAGAPVPAADWLGFLEQKSAKMLDDSELEAIAGGGLKLPALLNDLGWL